ncbi:MAG: hypothetical protein ACREDO_05405 [Methyloceanibacter sp.]
MFRTTALGLAAAATLTLGVVGPVASAFANYAACDEQPGAKGCPAYYSGEPGKSSSLHRVAEKTGAMKSYAHSQAPKPSQSKEQPKRS